MRFSVLTLNLHAWKKSDPLDRTVRFIAEENVSCICLQECGQRASAPLVDEVAGLRDDNTALAIRSRLEQYGLKYSIVWDLSHRSRGSYEEGPAVLSQLPVLGQCSRFVSQDRDTERIESRNVVMARLAAAPHSVIDVYSANLSPPGEGFDEQLRSLLTFIDETPALLEAIKPAPPRRRGPPRKRVPAQESQVMTRLICVAGDLNVEPGYAADPLIQGNYLEASSAARDGASDAATFEDGRWLDYVYIKPALRPQGARVVFDGEDGEPVSDHYGVLVEFEV